MSNVVQSIKLEESNELEDTIFKKLNGNQNKCWMELCYSQNIDSYCSLATKAWLKLWGSMMDSRG